jgi:hypothetical protein
MSSRSFEKEASRWRITIDLNLKKNEMEKDDEQIDDGKARTHERIVFPTPAVWNI